MTADVLMSQKIKEVLATYLKRDPKTILPEHNLRDDLGLDSLMTFELLYDLEKTFDLEIPNEDLPGLQTIADVVKYLEARISPEALRNIKTPSLQTQPSAPPNSSAGKSSRPASPRKPEQGEKARKAATPRTKAEAKPAPKAKPRTSQKVTLSKRTSATTKSTRTTQGKTKKK